MRLTLGRPGALALVAAAVLAYAGCTRSSSPPSNEPAAGGAGRVTKPAVTSKHPRVQQPQSAPAGAKPENVPALQPTEPAAASVHPPIGPVMARPHDTPVIYSVNLAPQSAAAGEVVSGSVITSSNVASVVATVGGVTAGVPKVGVGRFALSYRLPSFIPLPLHGTYTIVVVARNVDGVATSRAIPMTLH
jgi:hypothetical protein